MFPASGEENAVTPDPGAGSDGKVLPPGESQHHHSPGTGSDGNVLPPGESQHHHSPDSGTGHDGKVLPPGESQHHQSPYSGAGKDGKVLPPGESQHHHIPDPGTSGGDASAINQISASAPDPSAINKRKLQPYTDDDDGKEPKQGKVDGKSEKDMQHMTHTAGVPVLKLRMDGLTIQHANGSAALGNTTGVKVEDSIGVGTKSGQEANKVKSDIKTPKLPSASSLPPHGSSDNSAIHEPSASRKEPRLPTGTPSQHEAKSQEHISKKEPRQPSGTLSQQATEQLEKYSKKEPGLPSRTTSQQATEQLEKNSKKEPGLPSRTTSQQATEQLEKNSKKEPGLPSRTTSQQATEQLEKNSKKEPGLPSRTTSQQATEQREKNSKKESGLPSGTTSQQATEQLEKNSKKEPGLPSGTPPRPQNHPKEFDPYKMQFGAGAQHQSNLGSYGTSEVAQHKINGTQDSGGESSPQNRGNLPSEPLRDQHHSASTVPETDQAYNAIGTATRDPLGGAPVGETHDPLGGAHVGETTQTSGKPGGKVKEIQEDEDKDKSDNSKVEQNVIDIFCLSRISLITWSHTCVMRLNEE